MKNLGKPSEMTNLIEIFKELCLLVEEKRYRLNAPIFFVHKSFQRL